MFDRSAGLLPGLDDLVDRPSTNKLVGGFGGMRRNINAQQGRYTTFSSRYPDNTVARWAGSGVLPSNVSRMVSWVESLIVTDINPATPIYSTTSQTDVY